MTRVLLFTGEPILAKGLESILTAAGSLEYSGTCSTFVELLDRLRAGYPDILLVDLTPEMTFERFNELKAAMVHCKVVLWSSGISTELAFQAMGLGLRGILRKTLPSEIQVEALKKVQAGDLYFDKSITDSFVASRRVALTEREGQLVTLLSQGLKNKEIAFALLITEGTVKVYLSRLFQKLGVKDRFELALLGLKNLTPAPGNRIQEERPAATPQRLRSIVLQQPDFATPEMATI